MQKTGSLPSRSLKPGGKDRGKEEGKRKINKIIANCGKYHKVITQGLNGRPACQAPPAASANPGPCGQVHVEKDSFPQETGSVTDVLSPYHLPDT